MEYYEEYGKKWAHSRTEKIRKIKRYRQNPAHKCAKSIISNIDKSIQESVPMPDYVRAQLCAMGIK